MNVDAMRAYCATLPGTTESVKWEEHLCFCVKDKIYIITGFSDTDGVTLKVPPEEFEALTERDGVAQAGHMAKGQWIGISRRDAFSMKEWKELILQSYELVKSKLPKKVQRELEGQG